MIRIVPVGACYVRFPRMSTRVACNKQTAAGSECNDDNPYMSLTECASSFVYT